MHVFDMETKAEKLKKKMEEALVDTLNKPSKQRLSVIQEVETKDKSYQFKTVERNKTTLNLKEKYEMQGRVDNKYRPNHAVIERSLSKQILKWKAPEQEHQFFYSHNQNFRHNVELDIAQQNSDKRMLALKKLYFDYKNKDTFQKSIQLNRAMSIPKRHLDESISYQGSIQDKNRRLI